MGTLMFSWSSEAQTVLLSNLVWIISKTVTKTGSRHKQNVHLLLWLFWFNVKVAALTDAPAGAAVTNSCLLGSQYLN